MRVTKIYYEKCFNLGNFQNEKIGIEAEIDCSEDLQIKFRELMHEIEKVHRAKTVIDKAMRDGIDKNYAYKVLNHQAKYSEAHVKFCRDFIKFIGEQYDHDDMPF